MPQLVDLLSQETLVTILLRSESRLTLMSVCTLHKTPLAVCSLQAFNLHIPGKKEKAPARSSSQFFFIVIEMKMCTLGDPDIFDLHPVLGCLSLHIYLPPDPSFLWLSQILAMEPQGPPSCHVSEAFVLISVI